LEDSKLCGKDVKGSHVGLIRVMLQDICKVRLFTNLPIPSGRTRPWSLLSLYQNMSARSIKMFLGSKAAAGA
jgi:hypothetical protein